MKTLTERRLEAELRDTYQESFFLAALCVVIALVFAGLGWVTDAPDNSSARGVAYMGAIIFLGSALAKGLQGLMQRRDLRRRTRR